MLELGSLVRRDHDDLLYALRVMSETLSDEVHILGMLDRIRTGLPAHVEAETVALARMLGDYQPRPSLYFMASQVTAAHLTQETALAELLALRPATPAFRERARYLRHLMIHHADHEAAFLHPALSDHLPHHAHHALAQMYTEHRDGLLVVEADAQLRRVG